MVNTTKMEELVTQVRRDILRQVHAVNSGHPGGSLGCTEFFVTLFQEVVQTKQPFTVEDKGEDLLFLSNVHISPVQYSTLARSGYFPADELKTYRQLTSSLQINPTTHDGFHRGRVATGSVGQ